MGPLAVSSSLLLFAIGCVAIVAAVGYRLRAMSRSDRTGRNSSSHAALADRLESTLETAFSESRSHLERPPSVRAIDAARPRGDAAATDGLEQELVPVIRLDLGTTDTPSRDLVFEYIARILETIQPILTADSVPVRRYDIEVTFGPNGLFVSGECRRVSIPPSLATRLLEDERYRALNLRRDIEHGTADAAGEHSAVFWEEC